MSATTWNLTNEAFGAGTCVRGSSRCIRAFGTAVRDSAFEILIAAAFEETLWSAQVAWVPGKQQTSTSTAMPSPPTMAVTRHIQTTDVSYMSAIGKLRPCHKMLFRSGTAIGYLSWLLGCSEVWDLCHKVLDESTVGSLGELLSRRVRQSHLPSELCKAFTSLMAYLGTFPSPLPPVHDYLRTKPLALTRV